MAETSALSYDSGPTRTASLPTPWPSCPLQFADRTAGRGRLRPPHARRQPPGARATPSTPASTAGMQLGRRGGRSTASSMQQGYLSQSGMVSIFQDFPFSPDMVSEIKVVSSSYEPAVRLQHLRPDRGHHQVRKRQVPRRGVRVPPERRPERHASGAADRQVPAQEEQLRRQHRRPGEDPRPVVELGQDLLLRERRGLPAEGRRQPADPLHPLAQGEERATSATGATPTAT